MVEFDFLNREESVWEKIAYRSGRILKAPLDFFWRVVYGVRNLWYWLPVIWGDRDWDYTFILEILKHKLIRYERRYEKGSPFIGNEKEVKYIKVCRLLIDRIVADDYIMSKEYDRRRAINLEWAIDYMTAMEKQDMGLLFKILNKRLKYWWD